MSNLNYDKIRPTLNIIKNNKHPKLPKSFEETRKILNTTSNVKKYGYSKIESSRLYIDTIVEEKFAFMVFASYVVIDKIKQYIEPKERFYLVDGTFKIVPRLWKQLIVIAIQFKNDVRILIFL